jgi:hypothetical protein
VLEAKKLLADVGLTTPKLPTNPDDTDFLEVTRIISQNLPNASYCPAFQGYFYVAHLVSVSNTMGEKPVSMWNAPRSTISHCGEPRSIQGQAICGYQPVCTTTTGSLAALELER